MDAEDEPLLLIQEEGTIGGGALRATTFARPGPMRTTDGDTSLAAFSRSALDADFRGNTNVTHRISPAPVSCCPLTLQRGAHESRDRAMTLRRLARPGDVHHDGHKFRRPQRKTALFSLICAALAALTGPGLRPSLPGWSTSATVSPRNTAWLGGSVRSPVLKLQRPRSEAPPAPRDYRVLLESPVPGSLDISALAAELVSDTWNTDTILVRALMDEGASDIAMTSEPGRNKEMTFQLKLGIPWSRVKTYFGMIGAPVDEQNNADAHSGSRLVRVASRHSITVTRDMNLEVRSSYSVDAPVPDLHVMFTLRRGHGESSYTFAGAVDFAAGSSSRSSMLDNRVVQHFMEMGFLKAATRYGRKVLQEIERRALRQERGATYPAVLAPAGDVAAGVRAHRRQ